MIREVFLYHIVYSQLEILCLLQLIRSFAECFGNDGVKRGVGTCDRIGASYHTELKLVTGKCKGRSTVTVCSITLQIGQCGYACHELACLLALLSLTGGYQLSYHVFQLITQEYGYDSRRSLISSQTVIVTYICCGLAEQCSMSVNSFDYTSQYQQELDVCIRCKSGIQHIDAVIGYQ